MPWPGRCWPGTWSASWASRSRWCSPRSATRARTRPKRSSSTTSPAGGGRSARRPSRARPSSFPRSAPTWPPTSAARSTSSFFDGCEVVVRQRVAQSARGALPDGGAERPGRVGRGRPAHPVVSTQAPHGARDALAGAFGLSREQVRVIAPDVGGGFGAKVGVLPRGDRGRLGGHARSGRPVRWTETRSESMLGLVHGRGQIQDLAIGGTRDGQVARLPHRDPPGRRRLPRDRGLPALPDQDDGAGHLRTSPESSCARGRW